MHVSPEDWKEIFALRSELEDERDRTLLRKFIKYAEHLEQRIRRARDLLHIDGRDK